MTNTDTGLANLPTELLSEGSSRYLVRAGERPGVLGFQAMYRFPNGYGASVVRGMGTYGVDSDLFELAVTRYNGPGAGDWHLTYDTPITDDVLGWLTPEDVERTLLAIKNLPNA